MDKEEIKIVPFMPDHMDLFCQRKEDIPKYGRITSDYVRQMAEDGVCYTALKDGRILVVGGVLQTSIKTGYCWTLFSEYSQGFGLPLLRLAKKNLENMMRDMGLHRVETSNLASAEEHHRWCKILGFKEEGRMPYYDDKGREYIRFGKYLIGG